MEDPRDDKSCSFLFAQLAKRPKLHLQPYKRVNAPQCCSVVGNRSLTAQSPVRRARTSIVSPARVDRSSQRCRVDAEAWTLFSDFDANFAVGSLGQQIDHLFG